MQSDLLPLEAPLPPGTTRADIWTGRFCVSADIHTGDRRLLDLMRDVTRNYVDVRRLRVAPVDAPEQVVDAADGLLAYGFVKKTPVRVLLVLASQTIRGSVYVESTATDPVTYFLRGIEKSSERFLAVASASLSLSGGRTEQTELAIVNRGAVRLFSVIR